MIVSGEVIKVFQIESIKYNIFFKHETQHYQELELRLYTSLFAALKYEMFLGKQIGRIELTFINKILSCYAEMVSFQPFCE